MSDHVFIGVHEAAEILNVSVKTVYRLCAARKINPECGRKYGVTWRFRKDLVLENKMLKGQRY